MLLRRFYENGLAQASYLLGCQATGEALVVDPLRDVRPYLEELDEQGMTLRWVTETHIHADYLSGSRELARRTGAELLLSGEASDDWRYGFVESDGARLLHDGEEIALGRVRLGVVHTPGHTPEHVSFTVTDGAASDEPLGLLSGDFLFVGDVGRPDLLEKAAGIEGTMEAGARQLWASLQRLDRFPDWIQILPGHGAGSACGKALGAVPTSTLGYERLVGWAFQCADEEDFVARVLEDQPEPPSYFARMKRLNRDGPPLLGGDISRPSRLPVETWTPPATEDEKDGPVLVDLRDRDVYARAHLPGGLNLPAGDGFLEWAGWLLEPERTVRFLAPSQQVADQAARSLALIGLDRVEGWLPPEVLEPASRFGATATLRRVAWDEAERLREEGAELVDVRRATEFREGHWAGARHIHLGHLPDRSQDLPSDQPVLVYCRSGARSAIAASLLESRGVEAVDVAGGILERTRRGLPLAEGL